MRAISLRFWLLVSALVSFLLLISGGMQAWLSYESNLDAVKRVQASAARAAAVQINQNLATIESLVREVAGFVQLRDAFSEEELREEFHRLMKLIPAMKEIRSVDPDGRERVFVSRMDMDRLRSGMDISHDTAIPITSDKAVAYSRAHLGDGKQPYTYLVVRDLVGGAGAVVVDLNLRFVSEVVEGINIGQSGRAYVVDGSNHLLAHPNQSLVLRDVDLSEWPVLKAARKALVDPVFPTVATLRGPGAQGSDALISAVYIPGPDWLLFVEQPAEEAVGPVLATLYRTLALLALGLIIAALASLVLARRLTRPILELQRGVRQVGAGDLDARLEIRTGDELEELATAFKAMTSKLKESYADLEAKVEKRTVELARTNATVQEQSRELAALNTELTERLAELARRKEEADRASAAKTRFLASASHDLRQPMHAIALLVGILQDRMHDEDTRVLVRKVQMSVQAMENLFNSLLDISKLDAHAVRPELTEFEPAPLLRGVEANYAPLAQEKGITLRVRTIDVVVRSDPLLLERLVANLVTNAIRFTREGGVLLACRRHGGAVDILVYDTGLGIAPEYLSDIFEEFFQISESGRDRSKGLGLGLSIVKRTAELLGHELVVRSRPGRGSVFGVTVPFAAEGSRKVTVAQAASADGGGLSNAFVVVIDDDQESRFAMTAAFGQCGSRVLSAASATEAMELLRDHLRSPDLIVSDYRLGSGQTGLFAIHQIRSIAEQRVPAIIVTGDVHVNGVIDQADQSLIVMYKPVNARALRQAAEQLLRST